MKQAPKSVSVEKISFADHNLLKNLCGEHDKHLKLIENLEPVKVKAWGNNITISGKMAMFARSALCCSSFIR